METTLGEIARIIKGELKGNHNIKIKGISTPENPKENTVVFCRNMEEVEKAKEKASAVVTQEEVKDFPHIKVKDVKLALAEFLEHFFPEEHPWGFLRTPASEKELR
ncbi:hypothetical protein [Aquifex aeolicus]|uniref:hypothetical protein n=1 Tax=Aquifex aeolicus TaxID=63363 RepID=UPI000309B3BC|nr:hypothetical protein [Aquifex aeolicus]